MVPNPLFPELHTPAHTPFTAALRGPFFFHAWDEHLLLVRWNRATPPLHRLACHCSRRRLVHVAQPLPPPPQIGGRIRPTSPICSADLLGFWILPTCSADLWGFCDLANSFC